MRNVLRIDHKNGKIIMDRAFSIQASIYGTQEYINLQNARADYPSYGVERKTIKRNPQKEAFNGLTYAYMENYISKKGNSEIRAKYEELRFMAKAHSIRYPVIKKWFLETFPEMRDWGKVRAELAQEKENNQIVAAATSAVA